MPTRSRRSWKRARDVDEVVRRQRRGQSEWRRKKMRAKLPVLRLAERKPVVREQRGAGRRRPRRATSKAFCLLNLRLLYLRFEISNLKQTGEDCGSESSSLRISSRLQQRLALALVCQEAVRRVPA